MNSFFCIRFSVKSVSIGELYFAILVCSGSIQSPYNLADRFKKKYTQLLDLTPEIFGYTAPTLYPVDAPWSQLSKKRIISGQSRALFEKMRTKSRPEIEIADKRLAFSIQTPSIEPSYKTAPNQVKLSISQKVQGLWKNFRLQHVLNLVALTVRRPQHPYLTWCSLIFLHGNFSRLVP